MTYASYIELAADQALGVDYRIRAYQRDASVVVVAPHGGGIETGTSELVRQIAGEDCDDGLLFSEYRFEGLKSSGNSVLHITSTDFDEPHCRWLLANSLRALTVHGFAYATELVYVGGRDTVLRDRVAAALSAAGFPVTPAPPALDGMELDNITNLALSGAGVQLELSTGLRASFFGTNTGAGRWGSRTEAFHTFAGAVRSALAIDMAELG